MIVIEVSLYCCDKQANFGTNTHNPELYFYCLVAFLNSKLNKKRPNDNKYNSDLCVFVPRFVIYLSQQYIETSITIICNSKNLIG